MSLLQRIIILCKHSRNKEEVGHSRWDIPPCNIFYLVQPRAGCTPVAEQGVKKSTATVLKPQDIEIKEIHILRGYNMLSNEAGYVALDARDISLFLFYACEGSVVGLLRSVVGGQL